MKVMFDANVALDAFQKREPHHRASAQVISNALDREAEGWQCAYTPRPRNHYSVCAIAAAGSDRRQEIHRLQEF